MTNTNPSNRDGLVPTARGPGRVEKAAAVVAGALSVVVLVGLLATRPPSTDVPLETRPTEVGPPPERGDPALGEQLAQRAQATQGDAQAVLRLLLAAHVVAPDRAAYRIKLAQTLLGGLAPSRLVDSALEGGGSIANAALSADASFLVVDRAGSGQLWQTRSPTGAVKARLAGALEGPIGAAAGAGTPLRTNLVVAGGDGVIAWRVAGLSSPVRLRELTDDADAVAVTADGGRAVTVTDRTATLWSMGARIAGQATYTYDRPVTSVAFAPGSGRVLVAGHPDGAVTVHTIDIDTGQATARTLHSDGGTIDAVAVSADASTAAAMHQDGKLSVWDLRVQTVQPAATVDAATAGPHRIWLNSSGDYAFVADAVGAPALWSLVDRAQPGRLLVLGIGPDPAVPAMISADGATTATIDQDARLTLWDMTPVTDVLADPIGRACELADMTEQRWRDLVADPAVGNPCPTAGLPSLGVTNE